jgi:hypothetical protein
MQLELQRESDSKKHAYSAETLHVSLQNRLMLVASYAVVPKSIQIRGQPRSLRVY